MKKWGNSTQLVSWYESGRGQRVKAEPDSRKFVMHAFLSNATRRSTRSPAFSTCFIPKITHRQQRSAAFLLRTFINWNPSCIRFYSSQTNLPNNVPAALPKTWVDNLPPAIRPYLYLTRIDKPIGTLLLYYPCSMFSRSRLRRA